jgi:hypothetical protein
MKVAAAEKLSILILADRINSGIIAEIFFGKTKRE